MTNNTTESSIEQRSEEQERRIEILISNLLRTGVLTSLCGIVLGGVLMFLHHPEFVSSEESLQQLIGAQSAFPRTFPEILAGVAAFRGQAIATLGLLLLVATPVMRVVISIFTFIYQKDRVFVIITSVVLMLLVLSFVLGAVEG